MKLSHTRIWLIATMIGATGLSCMTGLFKPAGPVDSHGLFGSSTAYAAGGPDSYAIINARIVTTPGKVIENGAVAFRDGLIIAVGQNVKLPADARIIDGKGLTIYPGLIDAYTNLGFAAPSQQQGGGQGRPGAPQQTPSQQQAQQQQAQQPESHGDPSLSAADQIRPNSAGIEEMRSAGVTAALSSPRQGIFAGQSALVNLAGADASKMVVRAPVALTVQFSAGGGFGGGGGGGSYPGSLMGTVAFIRQTFYDAIHYRDEWSRYDKIKRGVSRPVHNKRLAALQAPLKGELPVIFIATSDLDISRALAIADEFKLKPIIAGAGAGAGHRTAELLKNRNIPVVLSVDFPRRQGEQADDEDEPLRVLRERAEAPKAGARLAEAGVKFGLMSGSLRAQDFISNVQRAVENGLSREAALRALTIDAAEILGVADQMGSIEVGKIANLVITTGDLFSRDSRVRHVFIDGVEIELRRPEPAGPARREVRPGDSN